MHILMTVWYTGGEVQKRLQILYAKPQDIRLLNTLSGEGTDMRKLTQLGKIREFLSRYFVIFH